jgi:hypothetical protein
MFMGRDENVLFVFEQPEQFRGARLPLGAALGRDRGVHNSSDARFHESGHIG